MVDAVEVMRIVGERVPLCEGLHTRLECRQAWIIVEPLGSERGQEGAILGERGQHRLVDAIGMLGEQLGAARGKPEPAFAGRCDRVGALETQRRTLEAAAQVALWLR